MSFRQLRTTTATAAASAALLACAALAAASPASASPASAAPKAGAGAASAGSAPTAAAAAAQSGAQGDNKGNDVDYYVSLGDSLAAGYQPDVRHDTNVSYTDQLYTRLAAQDPRLVHVKLGCSGETTQTMINGGICHYTGASSQLQAAEEFLSAHRGHVRYVTLDIGANDVDGCMPGGVLDQACVAKGLAEVASDVPVIAGGLRQAASGDARFAGMNYYDPFLAAWLTGPSGQVAAEQSVTLLSALNGEIAQGLGAYGWKLADVATAFSSTDFTDQATVPGIGQLPLNVARICSWTWECTQYHDIHATPVGHAVIADVFARVFGKSDSEGDGRE